MEIDATGVDATELFRFEALEKKDLFHDEGVGGALRMEVGGDVVLDGDVVFIDVFP